MFHKGNTRNGTLNLNHHRHHHHYPYHHHHRHPHHYHNPMTWWSSITLVSISSWYLVILSSSSCKVTIINLLAIVESSQNWPHFLLSLSASSEGRPQARPSPWPSSQHPSWYWSWLSWSYSSWSWWSWWWWWWWCQLQLVVLSGWQLAAIPAAIVHLKRGEEVKTGGRYSFLKVSTHA